jgi:hypothetical protein
MGVAEQTPASSAMDIEPPQIIKTYIDASNRHDVKSIAACCFDDAIVRDEGETLQGKKAIENWIAKRQSRNTNSSSNL